ncbi:MAG: hypothetical protein N4A72_22640 [Bacteroidales bacterium]|jgi:hypothetical protein|nr:hypothetical protein [Bacteroidales bacterium]
MNKNLESIIAELSISDETAIDVVNETLSVISKVYSQSPLKSYFEPDASSLVVLKKLGLSNIKGLDEAMSCVDLIEVYEDKDHLAFITMFFGKNSGYELSFKASNQDEVDLDKCKILVSHIAGSILSQKIRLDLFSGIAVYYLDEKYQTENMKAVIIVADPILEPTDISNGELIYRLIYGINQEAYELITTDDGKIMIEPWVDFIDLEFEQNPKMITKL